MCIKKWSDLALCDFTDLTAGEKYRKLEGIEKFFTYKMWSEKNKEWKYDNKEILYKTAYDKLKKLKSEGYFVGLVDPDSDCKKLQEIYTKLWDEKYLKHCRNSHKICGETMNSVQATLNEQFKYFEKDGEDIKEVSKKMKKINPTARNASISIKFLLDKFYKIKNEEEIKNFKKQCGKAEELIIVYHTLGNFIPFPVGCNAPRGYNNRNIEDYWDLTLYYIYKYYTYKNNNKKEARKYVVIICGEGKADVFIGWLDEFGSWDTFVEKNYMSAFVTKNGEKYDKPKELWVGHLEETKEGVLKANPLPKSSDQCNKFFKNAAEMIKKRGKEMAEQLLETGFILKEEQ